MLIYNTCHILLKLRKPASTLIWSKVSPQGYIWFLITVAVLIRYCPKTFSQSICTHYSCFENMGRFVTLKKRSKIWVAKIRVIVTQKEKRQPGLFSSWITMTLFFAPWFLQPIFWTLFLKFQTLKKGSKIWVAKSRVQKVKVQFWSFLRSWLVSSIF